ncbi:MAG: carbon-monoxide dehydrogenase small subunit [Myxococcota bacterium]|jgi:carbon-monoxide dehydrogenase small subunit
MITPVTRCVVNGEPREFHGSGLRRLLDVLRLDANLTGAKEGCGEGECGACTVLVDGRATLSCLTPVCQAEGTEIITVEGLAQPAVDSEPGSEQRGSAERLSTLQQAFIDLGGAQCGICTPGMLMAARALLNHNPRPSREEIREGLAGTLCRCTGYQKIVDAVAFAALETEADAV